MWLWQVGFSARGRVRSPRTPCPTWLGRLGVSLWPARPQAKAQASILRRCSGAAGDPPGLTPRLILAFGVRQGRLHPPPQDTHLSLGLLFSPGPGRAHPHLRAFGAQHGSRDGGWVGIEAEVPGVSRPGEGGRPLCTLHSGRRSSCRGLSTGFTSAFPKHLPRGRGVHPRPL